MSRHSINNKTVLKKQSYYYNRLKNSYNESKYERLRVRAYMDSPIVADNNLYLDGILWHAMLRYKYGADVYNMMRLDGEGHNVNLPLPIAKHKAGSYLSSYAKYQDSKDIVVKWRKRFQTNRAEKWLNHKSNIYTNMSIYKNYDMPMIIKQCRMVEWVIIGDKQWIEKLLQFAPYIGKKTSQGYGFVRKWTINPTDQTGKREVADAKGDRICTVRPAYGVIRHRVKASVIEL